MQNYKVLKEESVTK